MKRVDEDWARKVVLATERNGAAHRTTTAPAQPEDRQQPDGRARPAPEGPPVAAGPWLAGRPLAVQPAGRLSQVVAPELPVLKAKAVLGHRPHLLDLGLRVAVADLVVTTTPPAPRAVPPVDVGPHRLWPDPARACALVSLTALRLLGAAVTVHRDAETRISGGSATLTFGALPTGLPVETERHAGAWRAALAAAGHDRPDWRYLPVVPRDVQATVELPAGHVAGTPRTTSNPVAGSATVLVDLTAEGARVWSQALSATPRRDVGGLATLTLVSAVDGPSGLDVRRDVVSGTVGGLLVEMPPDGLTHVDPAVSVLARLVVDGDPTVATTVVDARSSSGTTVNQVFGPEGGTVELALSTTDPGSEQIHWTARVSFASGAWPVVRDSGTLSAATGWSDLVVPRSWSREISVTAMLLDPAGGVLPADGAAAGDQVTATLHFAADYLDAPAGLRTSFQTTNREHVAVRVPAPPGEDPGRATLTVMALRGARDALLVRELAPDEQWALVKVAHDAGVVVTTNRTPVAESSREAAVRASLAELSATVRPPAYGLPALHVPARAPRGGPPPLLRVEPGTAAGWVVEVASSPAALLAGAAGAAGAYWSSAELGLLTGLSVRVPDDAWQRLATHPVLLCRVWTSESETGWAGARVSTADGDVAAAAPRIVVAD